ncbi:discoidin domain-containing protein [Robinsoniella sp. KNHs210]|uniref:discoidin domain-containing protein n=1 Tax=Robinsoniella sp. KNHs210 TaxID=1469950 RepID=UPI00047FC723|nr:discoidin domain-containing protein [Robinsoniella sp. KNHs210]
MQKLKKIISGVMSVCIVASSMTLSPSAAVIEESKTETGTAVETQWDKVSGILDDYVGVYTKDTKLGSPWNTGYSPDGPLMGNGTVYAFMAGDRKAQNLYISHSNMWQDRSSDNGQEYTTFGGITIQQSDGQNTESGKEFRYEQDMKNAEVKAQSELGFTTMNWLSAKENIIVSEITNVTEEELPMEVSAWTANANTSAKVEGDTMIASKKGISKPKDRDSGTGKWEGWNVNISMASKIIDDINKSTKNIDNKKNATTFTLRPGQTVTMVSAIEGGKEEGMENTLEQSTQKAINKLATRTSASSLEIAKQVHREYWKEYWMKSYIDIQDADVERMYYGMLYQLGCSTSISSESNGGVAAGLFPWTANDHPAWQGDYTTNTDFQRQIHPLVQANRTSGIQNYLNIIHQYWPEAERRSNSVKDLNWIIEGTPRPEKFNSGIEGGALFPTHIGPWGASTEQYNGRSDYWNSPADATSVLMPVVKMWKYTQDEDLLEELYPLMKSVSIFWENYITFENGKYVVYGATHENVPGRNPILDVDACKYMLANTIKAANQLKTDSDKVEVWKNILDNMSDVPTMLYKGKTTICDVEGRTEKNTGATFDGNPVTIQSAYYFDAIGMSASDSEKEKYINYLNVKNGMGNHRRLISATRLGYDIHEIIEQLKVGSINKAPSDWEGIRGNNTIGDIGGTGRLAIVQDSLLQSNEGFINIFANWFDDQEASFRRMGAEDAFLVDADQNAFGQVTYANIYSEKGRSCSVLNPWQGQGLALKVYVDGKEVATTKKANSLGDVYTFDTEAGKQYELAYSGGLPEGINIDARVDVLLNESVKINVISNSDKKIIWESNDPIAVPIDENGNVTGKLEETATITATLEGTEIKDTCIVNVLTERKIPFSQLTGVADSEENTGINGPAGDAVDGNESTIWHSAFSHDPMPDIPNDINNSFTIDLGDVYSINKLEYLPRQSNTIPNGRILKYELWYSMSEKGEDFIEIPDGSGVWKNNIESKEAVFDIVEARRIRIRAKETAASSVPYRNKYICAAEFNVYEKSIPIVEVEAKQVVLSAKNLMMYENASETLTATVLPENVSFPGVTWKSSDDTVVSVERGVIKAVSPGIATITATSRDKLAYAVCEVTVTVDPALVEQLQNMCNEYDQLIKDDYTSDSWNAFQSALEKAKSILDEPVNVQNEIDALKSAYEALVEFEGIEINQKDLCVFAGEKEQLTVRTNREEKILWSSSDDNVVLLGKNGEMTAIAKGTATITASLEGTEYKSACNVTVEGGKVNYSPRASTITGSSVHEAGFKAENIADGKTSDGGDSNAWVSANTPFKEPKWVELDFDSPITINKWKITHIAKGDTKNITRDFSLQISNDKINWVDVDAVSGNTELVNERSLREVVTSSHFRLYITTADNYNGQWPNNMARIDELELLYETDKSNISVAEVSEQKPVKVYPGTTAEKLKALLPKKVEVSLSNEFTAMVPVAWDTTEYKEIPGTYKVKGILNLPDSVLNEEKKEASIEVCVEKYKVVSLSPVDDLKVGLGTAYEDLALPQSVVAVMDDGSEQEVNVIWAGDYDGNKAGDYMLLGTPDLGELYDNPNNITVPIKITVSTTQTIVAVNILEDVKTAFGTTQEELIEKLPSEVLVRLKTGQVCYLPVNWVSHSYDPNLAGNYLFRGILNIGEMENPENLESSINIIVLEEGKPAPEDLQALRQAVADAKGIAGDDYTKESYDILLQKIQDAENALEDPDLTMDVINEKKQAVIDAIKALEKKPCEHMDKKKIILLEPGCSTDGLSIVKCKLCGEIITQESIPALRHVFGEWIIKEEATIFKEGLKERICSRDEEVETCVIEKLPSCRVAFLDADNRVIGEVQTIALKGSANAPDAPKRAGYRFVCWDQEFTNITKDLAVCATYEKIPYRIFYRDIEGVSNHNPSSYTVEDMVTLSNPVKEGFTFTGWYMGNTRVERIIKGTTGDINLTAKWNKKSVKDIGTLDIKGIQTQIYTGKGVYPKITVKDGNRLLEENIHYVVRYVNNMKPGRATVTIQGVGGKYTGKEDRTFEIIAAKNKSFTVGNFKYTVTDASTEKGTVRLTAPTKRSFTSLTIPSSVKIGSYAYKVTEIGTKAFRNNKSLKKIVIGKNVKKIGSYAFDGDRSLKNVKISSKMVKEVGKKAFRGIDKKAVIKVPSSKFRTYQKLLAKKGQGKDVKISK